VAVKAVSTAALMAGLARNRTAVVCEVAAAPEHPTCVAAAAQYKIASSLQPVRADEVDPASITAVPVERAAAFAEVEDVTASPSPFRMAAPIQAEVAVVPRNAAVERVV
jgi:hypothetical protein